MQPVNQYKRGKPDLDGEDGPFRQKKKNGPAVSRRARGLFSFSKEKSHI